MSGLWQEVALLWPNWQSSLSFAQALSLCGLSERTEMKKCPCCGALLEEEKRATQTAYCDAACETALHSEPTVTKWADEDKYLAALYVDLGGEA